MATFERTEITTKAGHTAIVLTADGFYAQAKAALGCDLDCLYEGKKTAKAALGVLKRFQFSSDEAYGWEDGQEFLLVKAEFGMTPGHYDVFVVRRDRPVN